MPVTAHTSVTWWRSLNCDGRYGVALLGALLLLLAPLAGGDGLRGVWRYERGVSFFHEGWRLITAHVVHLDIRHGLLNAAGLTLLWALFARSYRPRQWLAICMVSIASVDVGLWLLSPQVQWYVGASALLHGAFAAGAIAMLRARERLALPALIGFIAKLLWEQWQGPLPFDTDMPVITAAHLYGAAGGASVAVLLRLRR
jgi:rhomboid family GlyGly-CTERM serine protease